MATPEFMTALFPAGLFLLQGWEPTSGALPGWTPTPWSLLVHSSLYTAIYTQDSGPAQKKDDAHSPAGGLSAQPSLREACSLVRRGVARSQLLQRQIRRGDPPARAPTAGPGPMPPPRRLATP
jgi:hypothetical protein